MKSAVAEKAAAESSIMEVLSEDNTFDTITRAVYAAGFDTVLSGSGPYTLFAPTDAAFAELTEGSLSELLNNREEIRAALSYHIVPLLLTIGPATSAGSLSTLMGEDIHIKPSSDGIRVNNARIIQPNLRCRNGIIHTIDSMLIPE